jgi:hypothetical protein
MAVCTRDCQVILYNAGEIMSIPEGTAYGSDSLAALRARVLEYRRRADDTDAAAQDADALRGDQLALQGDQRSIWGAGGDFDHAVGRLLEEAAEEIGITTKDQEGA